MNFNPKVYDTTFGEVTINENLFEEIFDCAIIDLLISLTSYNITVPSKDSL